MIADYIVILTMLIDGIYDISFCIDALHRLTMYNIDIVFCKQSGSHLRRVGLPVLFLLLKSTIQQGISPNGLSLISKSFTSTHPHSFPVMSTLLFYHLTHHPIVVHGFLDSRQDFFSRWVVLQLVYTIVYGTWPWRPTQLQLTTAIIFAQDGG